MLENRTAAPLTPGHRRYAIDHCAPPAPPGSAVAAPRSPPWPTPLSPEVTNARLIAAYEALAKVKNTIEDPTHRLRAASLRVQLSSVATPVMETRDDFDKDAALAYTDKRIALCTRLAMQTSQRPVPRRPVHNRPVEAGRVRRGCMTALREEYKDDIAREERAKVAKAEFMARKAEDIPALRYTMLGSWFNKWVDQDHLEALLYLGIVELEGASGRRPRPRAARRPRPDGRQRAVADDARTGQGQRPWSVPMGRIIVPQPPIQPATSSMASCAMPLRVAMSPGGSSPPPRPSSGAIGFAYPAGLIPLAHISPRTGRRLPQA